MISQVFLKNKDIIIDSNTINIKSKFFVSLATNLLLRYILSNILYVKVSLIWVIFFFKFLKYLDLHKYKI